METENILPTVPRGRGRPKGVGNKIKNNTTIPTKHGPQVFPAAEICRIIEQCGKCGVATFNFGGLSLTFSTDSNLKPDTKAGQAQIFGDTIPPQAILYPGEKVLQEELRQADLLISDPFAYEKETIDGFLNPNSSRTRLHDQRQDSLRPE